MTQPIEAQLADGTILEFPAGTSQSVVDMAVRRHIFNTANPAKADLNIYQRRMGLGRPDVTGRSEVFPQMMETFSGYNVGGKVTDALAGNVSPETAAAVGTGANFLTEAIPMFLGGGVSKAVTLPASQNTARSLMRSAVKPSSALPQAKVDRAMEKMLEGNISPTMGGMRPVAERVKSLDSAIDDILKSSGGRVSTTAVAGRLVDEIHAAEKQALNADDVAAIRKYWEEFVASHPENISVQRAHELKKGTYTQLGQGAYNGLQPTAELANKSKAQKALARGFREEVATAEPAAAALLREQSDLANVLSVAGKRALLAENQNPLTFATLAPTKGQAALWLLDRSPWVKGALAQEFYRGTPAASLGRLGGGYYGILGGQGPEGALYPYIR